jgi:signal transduction histidine kinase
MDISIFQQIVGKLPLGICVLDRDLRIQYWNDFFASRLNFCQDVIGQNLLELFPSQSKFLQKKLKSVLVLNNSSFSYWEHRPHIFEFNSTRPITGEETLMFQNLEIVPLEVEGNDVLSLCLILQDVTEQASYFQAQKELAQALEREHAEQTLLLQQLQATQNQLLHAEKMASIGQLAAGIAHEINNPIGFIRSNLQTLQEYVAKMLKGLDFSEKLVQKSQTPTVVNLLADYMQRLQLSYIKTDAAELIDESLSGATRVSNIINNLRAFSHVNDDAWQYADLKQSMESTLALLINELKYKVTVHEQYDDDLPLLYCQPVQLNQVFMIIILNAVQAIADKGDIWITVARHDNTLVVSIRDNGCGMSDEVKKRVFEPFFTTKEVGKGTGLGLSMAYNVLQVHQGKIDITSTERDGSTVTLFLPLKL